MSDFLVNTMFDMVDFINRTNTKITPVQNKSFLHDTWDEGE